MREIDRLAKELRLSLLVVGVFYIATAIFGPLYWLHDADDTDAKHKRSGMRLFTDYGTGCQYLKRGSLTPRLDENGDHICLEELQND